MWGWSECVSSFKAPPSQNGSRVIWLFYGAWVLGNLLFILKWRTFFERCRVLSLSLRRKMIDPFFKGRKEERHWEEKRWFCWNCHHTGAAACNVFELQQLMGKSWRVFQVPPQIHDHSLGMWCLLMASKTPTGPCTTTLDAFSKTHYLLFPKVSYYYLPQLDTLYTFWNWRHLVPKETRMESIKLVFVNSKK